MNIRVALTRLLPMCLLTLFAVSGGGHLFAQSKPNASPCDSLLGAMRAQLNAKSFRLKEIQWYTGEGVGVNVVTVGDYSAPDKYHATVDSDLGGSSHGEVIFIAGVMYAKNRDGNWQNKQADPQKIELEFARLRQSMLIDKLTKARSADVKLTGQELLGGSTMYVYQFSFAGPTETKTTFQCKVWVGVSDGLPHQIEMESRTSHKGLKFIFKTTTSYFDYNADIVITAPM